MPFILKPSDNPDDKMIFMYDPSSTSPRGQVQDYALIVEGAVGRLHGYGTKDLREKAVLAVIVLYDEWQDIANVLPRYNAQFDEIRELQHKIYDLEEEILDLSALIRLTGGVVRENETSDNRIAELLEDRHELWEREEIRQRDISDLREKNKALLEACIAVKRDAIAEDGGRRILSRETIAKLEAAIVKTAGEQVEF